MDQIKLNLKIASLELHYEGSQAFAEEGIFDLIERISGLDLPDVAPEGAHVAEPEPSAARAPGRAESVKLSTNDFAAKMGAKSGTDLVMAACAYLHHTVGSEEFRRSDILNAMKSAKAFYRASYGSNLSKSLDSLTKTGRLQNPGQDTFALPYLEIENTKRLL